MSKYTSCTYFVTTCANTWCYDIFMSICTCNKFSEVVKTCSSVLVVSSK